jgi:branched-chain amino acid transport system permease protein
MPAGLAALGAHRRRVPSVVAVPAVLLGVQAVVFPMPVGVYVQGLTLGLLGALVAVGLCLVYRANRIVNFAQSALGLVPTVVAVDLIVYSGWSFVVAGLAGAALSAALGLVLYVLVVKRFAAASRLILTVATIGIAQACLAVSLAIPHLWGEDTRAETISSGWSFDLAVHPLLFHAEHLLAWIVAPLALTLVAGLLLRTRVGAAVRAAADRPDRAATLGVPVDRLQMLVWAGAALLSFVGIFLRVAIAGLPFASTESFTALLSVLAALTVGRFTKLLPVAVTAVTLGVVEQAVTWNHPENPDLYAVVLAIVIFVGLALMATPRTRLDRDTTSAWQVGSAARPLPAAVARRPVVRFGRVAGWGVVVAGAVVLPAVLGTGDELKVATVLAFAVVGVSLVVLTGWAGQVSLGQMGFVAVGAAVGAWSTDTRGYDLSVGLIAAAVAGALVAVLVGLPALRLRGLYLAVVTLAFNVATASYLLKPAYAGWIPDGRITRGTVLGVGIGSERSMYWLCLAVLLAVLWLAHAVRTGRPGRAMVAQRDNELGSEAFGLSTTRTRLTAFGVSGGIAAVGGCLLVHVLQTYPDQLLGPERSISTFGTAVVGGIGSPVGAVVGAFVFVGSGWFLGDAARVLSTAIGLLLVLVLFPSGIAGAVASLRTLVLTRLFGGAGVDAEKPVAPPAPVPTVDPITGGDGDGSDEEPVPALRVRGLRVAIEGRVIVDDVSFEVARGGTLALLGTNGAGKSTVLNAVSGLLPVAAGVVELDGVDVTNRPAHRIAALGIVQAPGGRGVFPSLTVAENLEVAAWTYPRGDGGVAVRQEGALDAFPVLRARRREHGANLSGGEQQMLVLAMAWVSQPAVLLIDELSLGLAPIVVRQLVGFLDRIRAAGTTVVVVEQSPTAAHALTDRAVFLEQGRVALVSTMTELLDRPDLARSVYLANALRAPSASPASTAGPAEVALAAQGVSVRYGGVDALTDVSLDVVEGEILGLIGPNGAGKSTLLDALSGLLELEGGRIHLAGADVTAASFARRAGRGLGRSFQDAKLFPSLTVEEVLAIACDRSTAAPGVADAVLRTPAQRRSERRVSATVDELLVRFNLTAQRQQRTNELSTGQRRIVDLAALLADDPGIVLLDEPSSGLAQAEVEALGALLQRVHDELRLTMVVVEHDIPLISSLADRLAVLDQGHVIATGRPADVLADDRVISSYLGVPAPA